MEMDALDEPKPVYLFHMILGHHGVFSLTPIFLFSAYGVAWRTWPDGSGGSRPWRG